MKKIIVVLSFFISFISLVGCSNSNVLNNYRILKNSNVIAIEPYNSKIIGLAEKNKFIAINNKDEIENVVELIMNSKVCNKISNIKKLKKDKYYFLNFNIIEGLETKTYSTLYIADEGYLLLPQKPGFTYNKDLLMVSVPDNLKEILDNKITMYRNYTLKENDTIIYKKNKAAFLTLMGIERWVETDGKVKGVYEIKLKNINHRLYLISLGEQQYGSKLDGTFISDSNNPDIIINVSLKPGKNTNILLKSCPFLVLRTSNDQSLTVKWVNIDGSFIEVLNHYDSDYYNSIADEVIGL